MSGIGDSARLAALRDVQLLDQPSIESLDRYVRIARAALGVPVALVSLVTDRRQFFSSQCGLGEPYATTRETPLSHSFCKHVVTSDAPLVVEDARTDPRVAENGAVRDLSVVAYAGVPIESDAGTLGSFCAIDTNPRSWSERDLEILRELASAASDEIRIRRRVLRAETSERTLSDVVEKLETINEITMRTSRQNKHDLRAPLQVMSLGVDMLRHHPAMTKHPELGRLASMLERNIGYANELLATMHDAESATGADRTSIAVDPFFAEIIADLKHRTPQLQIVSEVAIPSPHVFASVRELRRSLENLVTNAQRFATSRIVLRARVDGSRVELSVHDDGAGLPSAEAYAQSWQASVRFHEHEGKSGTGLGLAIVRSIVEQLGGSVSAGPSPDGGAAFGFTLPVGAAG